MQSLVKRTEVGTMITMLKLTGKRVEYPSHTDTWMRGDRYGLVERDDTVGEGRQIIHVRMDRSGKLMSAYAQDCRIV